MVFVYELSHSCLLLDYVIVFCQIMTACCDQYCSLLSRNTHHPKIL